METTLPRSAAPKAPKCGFCYVTGHNIMYCPKKMKFGPHVRDVQALALDLMTEGKYPVEFMAEKKESSTIHSLVPTKAKYIILHKCYIINQNLVESASDLKNYLIEVTCLGDGGDILQTDHPNINWERQQIAKSVVVSWLLKRTSMRRPCVFLNLECEGYSQSSTASTMDRCV
jgi:hypothetical protein